jgi:hypothetical protein
VAGTTLSFIAPVHFKKSGRWKYPKLRKNRKFLKMGIE